MTRSGNYDDNSWGQTLREMRHSPCLMSPVSAVVLLAMSCFWTIALLMKFPALVLGILLGPALSRFHWIIEFLYPTGLGRWIHLCLMRSIGKARKPKPNDANKGYHSRAIETRIEVVHGRVFIHPLPQLLDNLGYLVLCCPPQGIPGISEDESQETPLGRITVTSSEEEDPIVAFIVDCGDAEAVIRQVDLISDAHYEGKMIQVQAILSTHKHHDHTAGNRGLLAHKRVGKSISQVVGGAVEKVPHCNFFASDGEMLPLPQYGSNDMNELVEVEVVATPAHTRGSVTYALRPQNPRGDSSALAFLFTGDTMFCAGGGVPFEADIDQGQEEKASRMTPHSFIKASAANQAVERCFAEILARSVNTTSSSSLSDLTSATSDRLLVFPGHEYTQELLSRQLTQDPGDSCKWKHFPPSAFFETVSQFYVAMHRRSLPHSSGKLLNVPSPVSRELLINPQFRSLKKRGQIVVNAIKLWHEHFAKNKSAAHEDSYRHSARKANRPSQKTGSTTTRWTLDANDISSPVFTTVLATDLDSIIKELEAERLNPAQAATRLKEMKTMLDKPVVARRPLPGTLPSDKAIYRGLVGFVLLGSPPCGLTLSDSRAMKIPPPIVSHSDRIMISKRRLVLVLRWLGLLSEANEGGRVASMIDQLWREAIEYRAKVNSVMGSKQQQQQQQQQQTDGNSNTSRTSEDVEMSNSDDKVDLGSLKWIVYAVPSHPPSWFSMFCRPCSKGVVFEEGSHPIQKAEMEQSSAELVRHDVFSCALCRTATGCPLLKEEGEEKTTSSKEQRRLKRFASTQTDGDDGEAGCIEITPETIGSMLAEA